LKGKIMTEYNFYRPEEVKPLYGEIVPAYQAAFAGEPWYEISKCADKLQRCAGGLSSLAVGEMCKICDLIPTRPAYGQDELVSRFENIAASRPTSWYVERSEKGLTLAAIAWEADAATIAAEKYADVPAMSEWLDQQISGDSVVWLDEVFANRNLQTSGNLRRFGAMCSGLMEQLQNSTLTFRTINARMIAAAKRDFGDSSIVFERDAVLPDRRDFVIIKVK
jgi:hypothetical protein